MSIRRGCSATATGLAIVSLAVSAGVTSGGGGIALILSFTGLLAGVNLIAFGVRMADGTTDSAAATSPPTPRAALDAFPRRNLAFMGLFMASSAVAVVAGDAGPVLCLCMLALHLLGISLITIGVRAA